MQQTYNLTRPTYEPMYCTFNKKRLAKKAAHYV